MDLILSVFSFFVVLGFFLYFIVLISKVNNGKNACWDTFLGSFTSKLAFLKDNGESKCK